MQSVIQSEATKYDGKPPIKKMEVSEEDAWKAAKNEHMTKIDWGILYVDHTAREVTQTADTHDNRVSSTEH